MINGKKYYVSDIDERKAKAARIDRIFIGKDSTGRLWFENVDEAYKPAYWKFAVEIPEPKVNDWTYETCPLPPLTVKDKDLNMYDTVLKLSKGGVETDNQFFEFNELRDACAYIPDPTDRTKELPCGSIGDE